ncbi:hypothetical protein R1flu_010444 [Riccia fluitans]|uniref:HMG box domain-containing protein n=1 Tax=Riccia fluitans TaxID=41844 RepID=A0ABD1Z965_9MARC
MPPRAKKLAHGVRAPIATALGENNSVESEKENILIGPLSGGDDLELLTRKLETLSVEKDNALKLLQVREAELELKTTEEQRLQTLLETKEEEQRKLAERVRKLEKAKEFRPTINVPVNSSATNGSQDSKKKNGAKSDKIKKPLSPFMMWCKEHRHQLKKEHPEASFAEMSRLISEKWKSVPEEEKVPFSERYEIEKAIYQKLISQEKREAEAMKLFQDEENKKNALELLEQYLQFKKEEENDGKKKKKEKDPEKPKKPTSGFFVFSNKRRPQLLEEKLKITEIGKKLGEEWKALDEKQREPYEIIALEDKARYAKELEAYKLKKAMELKEAEDQDREHAKVVKIQALQLLKHKEEIDQVKKTLKDEKMKKKRSKAPIDPNKPKKPPTSYLLFTKENRKLVQQQKPGASFSEINATLAIRWQEMSDEEKQPWVDKAAQARDEYNKALEEFNCKKQEVTPVTNSPVEEQSKV